SELAEVEQRGCVVRASGLFRVLERPEADVPTLGEDLRLPLARPLVQGHTLEPGGVVPGATLVHQVLPVLRLAEVGAAVVQAVAVDVVDVAPARQERVESDGEPRPVSCEIGPLGVEGPTGASG